MLKKTNTRFLRPKRPLGGGTPWRSVLPIAETE